jgi:hypothetical protein
LIVAGFVAQLAALADAGQLDAGLCVRERGAEGRGGEVSDVGSAEGCAAGGLFAGQVIECIHPRLFHVVERGIVGVFGQWAHQFQDAGDVVGVEMADHHQGDFEGSVRIEAAFFAELIEARFECVLPDAGRAAVDEDQLPIIVRTVMKHERIAVLCAECFEFNRHGFSYTDCNARRTSSMPAPWK